MGKYYNHFAQRRPDVSKLPNMTIQIDLSDVEEFMKLMKVNSNVDEFAVMTKRMPGISAIQILDGNGEVTEMYVFRSEGNQKIPGKKDKCRGKKGNDRITVEHYEGQAEYSDFCASMVVHANEINKGVLFDEESKVPSKYKMHWFAEFIGDIYLFVFHSNLEKQTRLFKIDLTFLKFAR